MADFFYLNHLYKRKKTRKTNCPRASVVESLKKNLTLRIIAEKIFNCKFAKFGDCFIINAIKFKGELYDKFK